MASDQYYGVNNSPTSEGDIDLVEVTPPATYVISPKMEGTHSYPAVDVNHLHHPGGGSSQVFTGGLRTVGTVKVSFFVNTSGDFISDVIVFISDLTSTNVYVQLRASGVLRFLMGTSTGQQIFETATSTFTTGRWYTFLWSYDGSGAQVRLIDHNVSETPVLVIDQTPLPAGTPLMDQSNVGSAILRVGRFGTLGFSLNGNVDNFEIYDNFQTTETRITDFNTNPAAFDSHGRRGLR